MREFSDFEKEILRTMVLLQNEGSLCRQNILYRFCKNIEIVDKGKYEIDIAYDDKLYTNKQIEYNLKKIYFLFEYLKSYFYIYDLARDLDNSFQLESQHLELSSRYNLPHIYKEEFITRGDRYHELLLSDAIVDLVNNDFKTHDQIRFEKQMNDATAKHEEAMSKAKTQIRFSQGAFYVALLAFLVSLVSVIITQCSNDNKLIRDEIRSIKTETPKLINQQIKNDTLKVSMIKK